MAGSLGLGNIDLRGLSPEAVRNVLGVAMSMKKMQQGEAARGDSQRKAAAARELAAAKAEAEESRIIYGRGKQKYSPVRKVGGRQVRDVFDDRGRFVETADFGAVDMPVSRPETPVQKRKLDMDLAKIEGWIRDPNADSNTLKGYIDYFNTNTSGDYKYGVVKGEAPKKFFGFEYGGTGDSIEQIQEGIQIAPQTAIDFLTTNPQAAEQFKAKYGYLPEGF